MAKRGEIARDRAKDIIVKAFGGDFLAIQDKKIYVMAKDESGEKIQFAITLTMPKTPIDTGDTYVNKNDWTDSDVGNVPSTTPSSVSAEVSDEDKMKIDELMRILGIVD